MREYKILEAYNGEDLERSVNDHLSKDWDLYGNLIITMSGTKYIQAMIKTRITKTPAVKLPKPNKTRTIKKL